jgi:16S rRNA (cytosine1402-N4)-methyltransferase
MDRDPDAADRARSLKEQYRGKFDFTQCKFSEMRNVLGNCEKFDAVLFDFGISSFQVDDADRGFSFMRDGTLDMRMSKTGRSAFDVVNSFSEEDLSKMICVYGEESRARAKRIAASIVAERRTKVIRTTIDLAKSVHRAVGDMALRKKHSRIDPATKTFQAIRIYVNDELSEIYAALQNIPYLLNDNARLATIAFHALEDRIVKNWAASVGGRFDAVCRNVIKPTYEEIRRNPRARSARMRGYVCCGAYAGESV